MTSATPKPRAGEHTPGMMTEMSILEDRIIELRTERDLLRERERELVEALAKMTAWVDRWRRAGNFPAGALLVMGEHSEKAHAVLAKHGR